MSDLCRRCHRPLLPKLELDLSALTAAGALEDTKQSWSEAQEPEPQIGCAVQRLRRMRGISQGQLGRMVGLRRTYLSRVENDHVMPGPAIVLRIAQALRVEMQDLFAPQPKRGNGTAQMEPATVRLVEMFSELQPGQMAQIVAQARRMCAVGVTH
jgi:transcriptional regulator with XRE-family HTH domain